MCIFPGVASCKVGCVLFIFVCFMSSEVYFVMLVVLLGLIKFKKVAECLEVMNHDIINLKYLISIFVLNRYSVRLNSNIEGGSKYLIF